MVPGDNLYPAKIRSINTCVTKPNWCRKTNNNIGHENASKKKKTNAK